MKKELDISVKSGQELLCEHQPEKAMIGAKAPKDWPNGAATLKSVMKNT